MPEPFRIGVVALFPELLDPVLSVGVVGRAAEAGLLALCHKTPRDFATDRHRTVDDRPYGGGPGMVMQFGPVVAAARSLRNELPADCPVLMTSAQGRPFDHARAVSLAAGPGLMLLAGRYEGVDERIVAALGAEEVSLGDYVLSGGELAAAVIVDAVARLLPGVLGHEDSAAEDSFSAGLLDCPHYTRPETVEGMSVPVELLAGDHAAVRRWRLKQALGRTWLRRPDLIERRRLSAEEEALLAEFRAEIE
jgi:tRNA (guanine37-N1)-methyltransferase